MSEIVRLAGIHKYFGGVRALQGVDFDLRSGEVHALIGENGAGKSTLMRVLGGEHSPTHGTVEVDENTANFGSPNEAIARGITVIHQEMALAGDLTVAENIFLGELPGIINWSELRKRTRSLIDSLGFNIPPDALAGTLSVAHQQVVEIAKALSRNARVMVFDEPTAVLSVQDAQRLLGIIRDLRAKGVAIIYISHRLDEVMQISDRITVLKDGASVTTLENHDVSIDELIRLMVGRPLSDLFGEDVPLSLIHIYQERSIDYGPAARLIQQAPQHLLPGGRLLIVANAFLPYADPLERSFGSFRVLADDGRFKVYLAEC